MNILPSKRCPFRLSSDQAVCRTIFIMITFCTLFSSIRVNAKPTVVSHKSPIEVSILSALSPYLTHSRRRDPNEQISVRGGQAEIWRYESFEQGDVEAKLCAAARSLFFGRLSSNKGIKNVFRQHNQLRDLSLIFYRQKTEVTPQMNGRYHQDKQTLILARFTVLRERVFSLDLKQTQNVLTGLRCVERAKELLNDLWISDTILERRQALKSASIEVNARQSKRVIHQETTSP